MDAQDMQATNNMPYDFGGIEATSQFRNGVLKICGDSDY